MLPIVKVPEIAVTGLLNCTELILPAMLLLSNGKLFIEYVTTPVESVAEVPERGNPHNILPMLEVQTTLTNIGEIPGIGELTIPLVNTGLAGTELI